VQANRRGFREFANICEIITEKSVNRNYIKSLPDGLVCFAKTPKKICPILSH